MWGWSFLLPILQGLTLLFVWTSFTYYIQVYLSVLNVIKDRLSISWLKNSLEKVMPPWSSSQFYHLVWHGILDLLLYFHWKNVIIYESSYGNSVFFYARCFIDCSPWSKLERWPILKAWEELLDLMLIPSSGHHILLFFNLEYDLWLCDLETLV
jgi:hypothetical protein